MPSKARKSTKGMKTQAVMPEESGGKLELSGEIHRNIVDGGELGNVLQRKERVQRQHVA